MSAKVLATIVLAFFMAVPAHAQLSDLTITAARKKLDEQRTRNGNETIVSKEIVYSITLESRSFKPMTDLQIKYMIFYQDSQPGSVGKPIVASHKGMETLAGLGVHETATVDTSSFKLTTTELDGNWVYTNGASGRSQDRVIGVWVRIYSGGKLVGEYANPTTMSKKNTWKE